MNSGTIIAVGALFLVVGGVYGLARTNMITWGPRKGSGEPPRPEPPQKVHADMGGNGVRAPPKPAWQPWSLQEQFS